MIEFYRIGKFLASLNAPFSLLWQNTPVE